MQIRPNTDPVMLAVLSTDAAAWASAYLKQQRHFDGDARHIELTAWFDAAITAGRTQALDVAADEVGEKIASEFRGFWTAEDLAAELPGMIRGSDSSILARLKLPARPQRFDAGDPCPACETPLILAPGIGEFCPNGACPVVDGPALYGNAPMDPASPSIAPPSLWRRFLCAIEPWYDWGSVGIWERLDGRGEGSGYRFEFEWLGLKAMILFGRAPPPQD